jgi:peptidoglycan/xylan/chitin deacetylase (PgdA/CDA1 family)
LRHALPVRADRTEPLAQGVHHAVVTFDDGFENVVHNALPELSKRQIPSAIFIITESLGKYPHWLTESYGSAAADRVMSEEQLKGLPAELVVVGSHTLTHPALPRVNEGAARRELSESRVRLEKLLARDIKLFSFPYGALNADLITWCREAGYRRVFSISPKLAFSDPDQFVTGRVSADPTDWPIEFYLKLMGAYCWLPAAFSLKRRLFGLLRRPAPKSFAAAGVES